ncbi:MAG: hypothetical protein KGI06_04465 [Candidatus Micrarchaeota archaeon]|nr:hypothetical protein [Candidatus Micrarchaeota archaeon]
MEELVNLTYARRKVPEYMGYDRLGAPTNIAIDKVLTDLAGKTDNLFIRFYNFNKPAVIFPCSDGMDMVRIEGISNYIAASRRDTDGLLLYVDDNILSYSIIGVTGNAAFNNPMMIKDLFGGIMAEAIAEIVNPKKSVQMDDTDLIRLDGKPIGWHEQNVNLDYTFLYRGFIAIDKWDAERMGSVLRLEEKDLNWIKDLHGIKEYARVKGESLDYYKNGLRKMALDSISKRYKGMAKMDLVERNDIIGKARKLAVSRYSEANWVYSSGIPQKESRFFLSVKE